MINGTLPLVLSLEAKASPDKKPEMLRHVEAAAAELEQRLEQQAAKVTK